MTGEALEHILDALHAHGSRVVRREGGRSATAQCPAHDDGRPSLSVTTTETRARVHCFAGCADTDVLDALGLAVRDLYNEPRGGDLASYSYTDLSGVPVRTVHRGEDKAFRQTGQTRGTAPLYRLPAVAAAVAAGRPVYVVEGEEDVHALEVMGAVATTAPMGARSFRRADVTPLAGAHVVVVPDRDAAGERWLTDVRAHLDGIAATLEVAFTATGKDASDHHAAGHSLEQLVPVDRGGPAADAPELEAQRLEAALAFERQVAHEVERLQVRETARERVTAAKAASDTTAPFDAGTLTEHLARPAGPPHRVAGLIPADAGTLIVAQRKTGKTTLELNLARCLLTGEDFLGRFATRPVTGAVAVLNFEVSGHTLATWAHEVAVPADRLFLVNLRGRATRSATPRTGRSSPACCASTRSRRLSSTPSGAPTPVPRRTTPGRSAPG